MGAEAIYIPLAIAAVSAGTAAHGASEQNKANKRSAGSAVKARDAQLGQVDDSSQLEQMKRLNQSNAIRSRLDVSAAERGVGTGGTTAALDLNERYNASMDTQIIARNQINTHAIVESQAEAQFAQIMSRNINPLLAAFSGGLSGLSSGLAIGNAFGGSGGGDGSGEGDKPRRRGSDPYTTPEGRYGP